MSKFIVAALTATLMLALQPQHDFGRLTLLAAAHADDDDDEGEGRRLRRGSDDDDDDAQPRRRARAPAPPRAQPAPPPPRRAANEILARGLDEPDLATLQAEGFEVIQRRVLTGGESLLRLRKPAALGMQAARDRVRQLASAPAADFNHFYRTGQAEDGGPCPGRQCLMREMIGWVSASGCGPLPRIGMVDTGLNEDHIAFRSARLRVHRLGDGAQPSDALHGTAVAALLVGDEDSRSPGLVPGADLVAVDAFSKVRSDERTDAFALIDALDYLAAQQVRIVNLSLAGPPNDELERQIGLLAERDVIMVAAAGNFGPRAEPAYPAAYDSVLAVTAVDRRGQVYRRANRGDYIDLAAPGVDVWTAASVSGARTKTGTSYAVPFVTAAAALWLQQQPTLSPDELRARMTGAARDLGPSGRDATFGNGLLSPPPPCTRQAPAPAP